MSTKRSHKTSPPAQVWYVSKLVPLSGLCREWLDSKGPAATLESGLGRVARMYLVVIVTVLYGYCRNGADPRVLSRWLDLFNQSILLAIS